MIKKIKKSLKYFIIVFGIIVLLPTVLYLILQIPDVQTLLVKRITNHFSDEINSTISVGHIEYKFFKRLLIKDMLIKDKNSDTLFYAQNASIGFRNLDVRNKYFRLGRVILVNPVVAFITDSTGMMNLTWYINMLKNPSDTTKKGTSTFIVDQIDINNARFSLINHYGIKTTGKNKIDFNNVNLAKINGIVEDLKISGDTTAFKIYNFGFKESGGFSVKKMSSSVMLAKQDIMLKSTSINCDSSIINISRLYLLADSSGSFKKFTEEVKLDVLLDKSLINSSDLQYFFPFPNGLNESIWVSGKFLGTVSELRGRNIELSYRDYTSIDCDFDFSGLPKIENTFIYIGVNSLNTNALDFEKINIPGKGFITVPDVLYKLGNISFDGSFTGFITDFVTYGKISTTLGNIRTDISLRPEESDKYRIKGLITGSEINLGELTGKPELLGKVSMQSNVDGYAYSLNKFAGNLTGKIDSIEINRYEYRNIDLNGYFTEKTWDGSINIDDENIKLSLLGLLNFKNKLPEFDFTLNIADARLYKLNFAKLDTTASVTLLLTSNFKGSSIDNLDGEIKLLNSSFTKYGKNLELYDFSIRTFSENNNPVLSLRTDFVDADIRGYYNFAALGMLVNSTLSKLMPSQFPEKLQRNELKKNNFTFEINFKNTDKINSFFRTGLLLADKSNIKGVVSPDSIITLSGRTKLLSIKNNSFTDLSVDTKISGSDLFLDIGSSSVMLLGQSELKGLAVKLLTKPDNFVFTIDWDNKEKEINKGNFVARGNIAKNKTGKGMAILTIDIDSTSVYVKNNQWKISPSSILVDSNAISINKLNVSNRDRYYLINGSISENPADTLHLEFRGIDIAPLNYIGNQKNFNDPNKLPLDIKGILNGKILLTNVYNDILLESNITVRDFSILTSSYGDISIVSAWDKSRKVIRINASNNLAGVQMFNASGTFDPLSKKIELYAKATKLPVGFLNPLLKTFASDITGLASGKVSLLGEAGNLYLKGAVFAENASMKINYLQTRYKMNDTVRFDKNGFKFNSIRLSDDKGNIATLTGSVNHKNFHDYIANIVVYTNDCMVLNTKPKDNELFYGTAYASGRTTIKSAPNLLSFDISARTGKNTKFFIPLTSGLSVSEYSFITFVDSANNKNGMEGVKNSPSPAKQTTNIDMNIDLEVTPDAEVQIIFDSKVGDVMKGHGSGNLNITMNKADGFKMSGDYIIEDGDYLFTLGNILNKPFSVENGGKIIFNGDLDNAEIDIKAIYKLKASLLPILGEEVTDERIPIECQLNLTGRLFNPIVSFNIYLPTADERTRTYLRNTISTEEELNRQFFSLLVMNSFISLGSTSSSPTAAGTSAVAATTWEMVSNQVSNWLSQISNDFELGFAYRPGTGNKDLNPQEVQVALSTQILNDKVVINSNIDLRGAGSTTGTTGSTGSAPITGDFDVEYKITEKVRFKVFNRFNNPYTGRGVPYTQGIGIFFKRDFNTFSDLFKKKVKSDMKKEEDTTIKKN